ncbi:MAG: ankyrin repeat domain-containing protein [Myxococcaceae bacterium]
MGLVEAIQAGDAGRAKELLAGGADVNEPGPGDTTPLIEAAGAGRSDLVKLLLEAGAEPMLRDGAQDTALLKAAANGHAQVCALLSPLATPDERDTARAFLAALGKSVEAERSIEEASKFGRGAAEAGAFVSKLLGNENPARRLERIDRADKRKKR